jgi:glutaredoxin
VSDSLVILYSTGCPRCNVLTQKLNSKDIQYTVVSDVEEMEKKGIETVPVLEVDGQMLQFKEATDWVNGRRI